MLSGGGKGTWPDEVVIAGVQRERVVQSLSRCLFTARLSARPTVQTRVVGSVVKEVAAQSVVKRVD